MLQPSKEPGGNPGRKEKKMFNMKIVNGKTIVTYKGYPHVFDNLHDAFYYVELTLFITNRIRPKN